jgi:hypothetical protein
MPNQFIEILKVVGPLAAAMLGGVGAFIVKERFDSRKSRRLEAQTRWWPLYNAVIALKQKLDKLVSIYRTPKYSWKEWQDGNVQRILPSESRDFHELYLIEPDPKLIVNFWVEQREIPRDRRKEDSQEAVQRVRERIHELNTAAVSLYSTALYLAYAQRVSQELQLGKLKPAFAG